jgi:hypothetical protein
VFGSIVDKQRNSSFNASEVDDDDDDDDYDEKEEDQEVVEAAAPTKQYDELRVLYQGEIGIRPPL